MSRRVKEAFETFIRSLARAAAIVFLAVPAPAAHAAACASQGSGTWGAITWSCGALPGANDDVTISNGNTVTLDRSPTIKTLTVTGTFRWGNNNTARVLTVAGAAGSGGNVSVSGTMTVNTGSNTSAHRLIMNGDLSNTGTVNLAPDGNSRCSVTFNRNGTQTISGTGTYSFYVIYPQMTSRANILHYTASNFTFVNGGYIYLQPAGAAPFSSNAAGTFSLESGVTVAPFDNATLAAAPDDYIITATAGFVLANSGATINHELAGGTNISVDGLFQIDNGTFNLGNATNDQRLRLRNTGGNTATITVNGGSLVIAGRLTSVATTDNGTFNQTGGTVTVGTVGNTTGTFGPFFLGSATAFNMSGGIIEIQNSSTAASTNEFDVRSSSANVTGGTVYVNAAAAGDTFDISHGATPSVWNLAINGTNSPTVVLQSALTVKNDLSIGYDAINAVASAGGTLNANNGTSTFNISIGSGNAGGTWTNNGGTFNASTGTVTFTGTGAQSIAGTSGTTFNDLTVNKGSNNVTISRTPTISGTFTLTSGLVITGANRVDLSTTGVTSGGSSSSYVQGTIRKNYGAGANLSYSATDFPLGDGTYYLPADMGAGTANNAGTLDATVVIGAGSGDHAQVTTPIASTAIDATKSVNRYWTFTSGGGLTLTSTYAATFTFVSNVVDGIATPTSFIVQRYDGSNWNPTVLGVAGATSTTVSNINGFGDFAIGERFASITPVPGRFNAFETTTPANSLLGRIHTKIAGQSFTLSVIHVNAAGTGYDGTPANNVTIDLLDSSDDSGALNASTGCRSSWTVQETNITGGTVTIGVSGRNNAVTMTAANVYRNARLRIQDSGLGQTGCSTDRFAIRPASLTASGRDATWTTTGTSRLLGNSSATGGNVHKAGTAAAQRPFTLRATPIAAGTGSATNYDGMPTVRDLTCVALPTSCATNVANLSFTAGGWTAAGSGARDVTDANYAEAGVFKLQLEDTTFANIDSDAGDGSTATERTIPPTDASAGGGDIIGRFVPDKFTFTGANTPKFGTWCTGGATHFTYLGQYFAYATAPSVTFRAENAAGALTTNYRENAWKVTLSQAYGNTDGGTLDSSQASAAPTFPSGNGTSTITVSSSHKLRYTGTPSGDIASAITLDVTATDSSDNAANQGTIANTNTFSVGFNNGNTIRYGRLRMKSAYGSELLALTIPIQLEYRTSGNWVVNTSDTCTSFVQANVQLSNYKQVLATLTCPVKLETPSGSCATTTTICFASGVSSPRLHGTSANNGPGSGNRGSVDLTVILGTVPGGAQYCNTVGGAPVSVTAPSPPDANNSDFSFLQYDWNGDATPDNPTGRASFGVYGGTPNNLIYRRENY